MSELLPKSGAKKIFLVLAVLLFLPAACQFAHAAKINPGLYDLEVDYSRADLYDVPADGYLEYIDDSASFRWKVDIFLPDESPIIGLGPLRAYGTIIMHLKDINGTIFVPADAEFDGMGRYAIAERYRETPGERKSELIRGREVNDRNELVVSMPYPVVSLLGNNMFDPPQMESIRINDAALVSATIFIPKTMALLDYSGPIRTFRLNDHAVFSHQYAALSVIYANEFFKLMVQLGLGVATLFFVFLVLRGYRHIPRLDFGSRHILALLLIACMLMMQLAFLVPNPKATVWDLYLRPEYKGTSIPAYLYFIVGFTDSLDALVVRSFEWWEEGIFSISRAHFLTMKSAKKIIIPEGIETNPEALAAIEENFGKEKIEFAKEGEIKEIVEQFDRHYPWEFIFGYSRRVVFGLFLLASFLATAFLFLKAFEVKTPGGWLAFLAVILLTAFGMQYSNIVTGFIAHMPVLYHGASTMPFTMSAKFLPIFDQAHSLRLALLVLGPAFVFIFHKGIRKQTSIRAFFVPVLILAMLLTLPQTEFSVKRGMLGLACGDCGITYRGSLETVNFQQAYHSLREDELISTVLWESNEEYLLASKLESQGKYEEALRAYEDLAATYPDAVERLNSLVALGRLYNRSGRNEEAIETYKGLLGMELDRGQSVMVLTNLAYAYMCNGQDGEAEAAYRQALEQSTNAQQSAYICWTLGTLYQRMGREEDALRAYREILERYSAEGQESFWTEKAKEQIAKLEEMIAARKGRDK